MSNKQYPKRGTAWVGNGIHMGWKSLLDKGAFVIIQYERCKWNQIFEKIDTSLVLELLRPNDIFIVDSLSLVGDSVFEQTLFIQEIKNRGNTMRVHHPILKINPTSVDHILDSLKLQAQKEHDAYRGLIPPPHTMKLGRKPSVNQFGILEKARRGVPVAEIAKTYNCSRMSVNRTIRAAKERAKAVAVNL